MLTTRPFASWLRRVPLSFLFCSFVYSVYVRMSSFPLSGCCFLFFSFFSC